MSQASAGVHLGTDIAPQGAYDLLSDGINTQQKSLGTCGADGLSTRGRVH
jgi:hypothetical protein